VFDLFVQVDQSMDRSKGGLGIGLTLVKWLVELHGGTVAVRSELGLGSEFTVRLPLALSLVSKQDDLAAKHSADQPQGRRILVADDNSDAVDNLAQLLQMMGHEVRTANKGYQSVEIAQSFRPHLTFFGYRHAKNERLRRLPSNSGERVEQRHLIGCSYRVGSGVGPR
jgi:hypothetical protein